MRMNVVLHSPRSSLSSHTSRDKTSFSCQGGGKRGLNTELLIARLSLTSSFRIPSRDPGPRLHTLDCQCPESVLQLIVRHRRAIHTTLSSIHRCQSHPQRQSQRQSRSRSRSQRPVQQTLPTLNSPSSLSALPSPETCKGHRSACAPHRPSYRYECDSMRGT